MKTTLQIRDEKTDAQTIIKTSVPIQLEDIYFLDALADEIGISRSKLLTRAIGIGAIAEYNYLQSTNKKLLEKVVQNTETMAHENNHSEMAQNIFTTYGLEFFNGISFEETK